MNGTLPHQLSRLARSLPADPVRAPAAPAGPAGLDRPVRRVRHEVRDGLAVVAFSALASTGVALALLLLVRVAG